ELPVALRQLGGTCESGSFAGAAAFLFDGAAVHEDSRPGPQAASGTQAGPALVYLAEDALPIVRQRVAGMARQRGLDLAAVEFYVITAATLRLDRDPHRTRLFETARRLRPRLGATASQRDGYPSIT
ncbi:MAG TPA: hypothetical protein QF564_34145, partial [Pirellulaceae bacterium]|nr:hypothetical protein [Pirellulaceae bacterium]